MWMCQQCNKKFQTTRAAENAAMDGCPSCGSVDIDLAPTTTRKMRSELTKEEQRLVDRVVSGVNIELRKF